MEQKTSHPDSIEKWAEWLDSQPKHTPMTDSQSKVFISATLSEDKIETDANAMQMVAPKQQNYASMFYNRVKCCHSYEVTIAVALFISTLIDRPGVSTIYANYLQYKAFKMGKKKLTMNDIAFIWPFGLFSSETLELAWDKQKCADCFASNLLDNGYAQKSIEITY